MTMDVQSVLPDTSPVFKPNIIQSNGKIDARMEFRPHRNGYHQHQQQQQQQQQSPQKKIQYGSLPGFSLNPACACLLMLETLMRFSWIAIRTVFVTVNNCYCIPTYTVWMILLMPLRTLAPKAYWRIEGRLFHWLLSMVSLWSYSAGYQIMESGDKIDEVAEEETLVLSNHQSTSDVPLLMAAFNTRKHLLPNLTWIMDHIFKFTNFGVVSALHGDFFVISGKDARERTISELSKYLGQVYIPRERKWIVLFPEGGFLHKRRAVSQRYAEKNNLPHFQHVTVPRMGAVQAILDGIGPKVPSLPIGDGNHAKLQSPVSTGGQLKYILDITIAYPNGEPLDIFAVVSGYIRPCKVHLHYRLFPIEQVPTSPEDFQAWLLKIYTEKEKMLNNFYETGKIAPYYERSTKWHKNWAYVKEPTFVDQDLLRMAMLHSFFICSSILHWTCIQYMYTQFVLSLF